MNKNEKNAVVLMLFLFAVGFAARYVPWSLPEIGETPVLLPNSEITGVARVAQNLDFHESAPAVLPLETPGENTDTLLHINEDFGDGRDNPGKKVKKKSKPKVNLPLHINTAPVEHLCAIPGVGPKLAEKIIEFRKAHGPIKNESELKKVPGIGDKKSKKLLPSIIFD